MKPNPRVGERYVSQHNATSRGIRTIEIVRVDFRSRELEARLVSRDRVDPAGGACACKRCQQKRSVPLTSRPDRIIHMTIKFLHQRWKKENHVAA